MSNFDSKLFDTLMSFDKDFNIFYVYFYYESENALPIYVGKGSGDRAWTHLYPSQLQIKTPFHDKLISMISAGVQPSIEIIEDKLTEQEAFKLEKSKIKEFGRREDGGCLYNLTLGGDQPRGYLRSEEIRNKMRIAQKGKVVSLDTRKKLAQASFGTISATRRSIKAIKSNGEVFQRYEFIGQVIQDGFNRENVHKALRQNRKAYGLTWRYE